MPSNDRLPRPTPARLAILALILVAFLLGRAWEADRPPALQASGAPDAVSADSPAAPSFWVCPMGDIPPVPRAGKCPICGMELVPAPGDASAGEPPARLALSEEDVRRAGIRLAPVERKPVSREIPLYGRIEYDPGYFAEISAFAGGVLNKIYVRRAGDWLRPEQKLFELRSQEIYAIEQELLGIAGKFPSLASAALRAPVAGLDAPEMAEQPQPPGNRAELIRQRQASRLAGQSVDQSRAAPEAARPAENAPAQSGQEMAEAQRRFSALRYRLRSYGMLDSEINQVLKQREPTGILPVRLQSVANIASGVVLENRLASGRWVNPGELLMVVADSRFIWANLEGFESDFPWVRFGQEVRLTTEARPGEVLVGKASQLSPTIDPERLTFSLGVTLDPATKLRPNMTVHGTLLARLDKDGRVAPEDLPLDRAPLVIPAEAPLLTGERAVVWTAVPGRANVFERRDVVLGPKADQGYVVKEGLAEGEMVVVNGAFKVDSEAQILGRPSMLNEQPRAAAPAKSTPRDAWPRPAPQYSPPGDLFQAPPPRLDEQRDGALPDEPRPTEALGQAPGQLSGQTPGQAFGQAPGQRPDQPLVQPSGQAAGRASGDASAHAAGHAAEPTSGQTSDQNLGQTPIKASGQSSGQPSEQTPEQVPSQPSGRPLGQTAGHDAGRPPLETPGPNLGPAVPGGPSRFGIVGQPAPEPTAPSATETEPDEPEAVPEESAEDVPAAPMTHREAGIILPMPPAVHSTIGKEARP